jgi:hypothetical protein
MQNRILIADWRPKEEGLLRLKWPQKAVAADGRAACVIRSLLKSTRGSQFSVQKPDFYARNSSPPCVLGFV